MPVLLIHDDGPVRKLTLNRPERRNALTPELIDELTAAFLAVSESSARILVLAGAGESFCSGLDLSVLQGMAAMTADQHATEARRIALCFRALWECPIPTIAEVQGAAVAGGMGLATLCDVSLAGRKAKFGYTEVRIGFIPALVSAYLALQVGDKIARDLLLSGRILSSFDCCRRGLVTEVVREDELAARTAAVTAELLRNSPQSLRDTKALLRAQHSEWLDRALALAMDSNAASRQTEDFREGVASFLEKRKPSWQ